MRRCRALPRYVESSVSSSPSATSSSLSLTQWLVLIMPAIGSGFDIYVLLVMPSREPAAASRVTRVSVPSARGDRRLARRLALHADFGGDSCHPPDHHPAVLAGVAGLEGEEAGRDAEAAQLRRVVRAGAAAHHDRH